MLFLGTYQICIGTEKCLSLPLLSLFSVAKVQKSYQIHKLFLSFLRKMLKKYLEHSVTDCKRRVIHIIIYIGMKESEYAQNNVDAKVIIASVLDTLKMNAPAFSTATGIAYQRIYDLQRGRTKKFNPGVVNMIVSAFPQVRKEFLYTGDGPVLSSDVPADLIPNPSVGDPSTLLAKVMQMQNELMEKAERLMEKEAQLNRREIELMRKEHELDLLRAKLGVEHETSEKKAAV